MGAVIDTVNNVTVDQAMGLVALQDMAGVDNLDFSIAGDESLTDLSVMQAMAAVEATNVVAGDVSVKDFAGMIVAAEYDMPETTSIDLAAVQQVTVMTERCRRGPDDLPHAGKRCRRDRAQRLRDAER